VDCHQELKFDFDHGYKIVLLSNSTTKINIIVQIIRNSDNFCGLGIMKVFSLLLPSVYQEKNSNKTTTKTLFS